MEKKNKNPRIGALIWESKHDMFKEDEEKHTSYLFFQSYRKKNFSINGDQLF